MSKILKRAFPFLGFFLVIFLQACGSGSGSDSAKAQSTDTGGGGSVVSSPTSMGKGDVAYLDLGGGSASISLPSSGKFEVLLQSHATGSSTNTVTLSSLSGSGKALGLSEVESDLSLAEAVSSPQDLLDGTLRRDEEYYANEPLGGQASKSISASKDVSKGASSNVSAAINVDDTAKLYVLSSLTDTTQCVRVTATAKYVSSEVAIFVDNEILSTNPSDLPQSDINTLGSIYDGQLPDLRSWFGSYSDINKDGVVIALISSQVNKLGASGGGIVTGFFNSSDLSSNSSSNPCSNEREIVYLVSPDSKGVYSTKVSNGFFMSNFGPAVFPHETQHLINYYQRVVVRGGTAEKSCLNEGISHLVEDLVGYGRENYSRAGLFLNSPQSYSACGGTSLAQRGGIYLLLRYLYDRSGKSKDFLKNLIQTTSSGYDNIVQAYPGKTDDFDSIGEFIREWGAALAYTNSGVSTASKFGYNARVKNATTGNWEGCCTICQTEDGRGTVLTGPSFGTFSAGSSYTLKDAATRFLKISGNPSKISLSSTGSSKGFAIILRTE